MERSAATSMVFFIYFSFARPPGSAPGGLAGSKQDQMVIWLENEKKRIGARCRIHPALEQELRELLGEANVVLK